MEKGRRSTSLVKWGSPFAVVLLWWGTSACERTSHAQDSKPREVVSVSEAKADDHDHDHDHGSESDLDKSAESLFNQDCEHGIKAFSCDECRYEVGVVRVAEPLMRQGLFELVHPGERAVAAPLELTAEVRFDDRLVAHVRPVAQGIIRKVHVVIGDEVKQGAPLLEMDSVAVGDAYGELLEARARLVLAKQSYERAESLKKSGLASEKDYLEVKTDYEAARIRVDAAQGRVARLGGTGAGTIVLRAPMTGKVLELHAVPGEVASSDESIATVGNHDAVWVWADLFERDLAKVMDAQNGGKLEASVFVEAYANEAFSGVVDLVSPSMDRKSRTVKVRVAVDNPKGRLLAGMFAKVQVFLPGGERALAVPREAVLEDEGRSFVFVHHHGEYFVRRPVRTGRAWGGGWRSFRA